MKITLSSLISGIVMLFLNISVYAFDNGPTWFGFKYTLNTSGARTIGMGGTAVASANDASATLTNPAALVRLSKTEFRLDSNFRHLEETNKPGGDNIGTGKSIRLGLHVNETNQIDPALMALAGPTGNGSTVVGLFYHEFLPYDRFVRVTDPISGGLSETHSVMFDLDEFGFSVAHKFFNGKFAIGLSASWVTPSLLITAKKDMTPQPSSFDGIEFTSYGSKIEQEPVWRLGLLYSPTKTMAFGINYTLTQDPQYTMTTVNSPATVDSAQQNNYPGDINIGSLPGGTLTGNWICESSLPMPKSISVGFAYTPNEIWVFAIDTTYVEYSRATREFVVPYAYPGGDIQVIQKKSDFKAKDVVEVHLGFEYKTDFIQLPMSLRAGYYFDPAHDIEYFGTDSTSQVIYPGGKDVNHFTAGAGVLIREIIQIDMAFDGADDDSYRAAVSLALRY